MNLHRGHSNHFDAVVIGARVAGPAVSMLLARAGLRVLMVDRRLPGGDTLSTHALMRAGVMQLSRWGLLEKLVAAGTPTIRQAVIHYADEAEKVEIKPRDGIDGLYAPRRTVLDPMLVEAAVEAGVDVRFGHSVIGLVRDRDGRVLGVKTRHAEKGEIEFRAPITIGADGIGSTVAREVGSRLLVEGRSSTAVIYGFWSGEIAAGYDWFYRPGVAAGLIPTNDGQTNVWVGSTRERFMKELRFDLEGSFHKLLAQVSPQAAERLQKAKLGSRFFGFPGVPGFMRQAYGPGWALVGDASHFKDPISAHGITDALRDAEFLAQAVIAVARGTDSESEALGQYQKIRDRLSTELHDASERVASYSWNMDELRSLLMAMSRSMQAEVRALAALDQDTRLTVAS